MRKQWCIIGMMGLLLSACTTNEESSPPAPTAQTYNGPVVEIGGAEPRYEPYDPRTLQDYEVNGKRYQINKNPHNFSQTGLAAWYDNESGGNRTATGEEFDANALTAAHPTLPLPSSVRVTNLSNGRQLVVRVNDRGPYTPGRIIDLSRAAGDRLNISNNTKVRVDFIQVAQDGTLSGPGTIGTVVAKQNFALPPRPDLSGGGAAMSSPATAPAGANSVSSQSLPAPSGGMVPAPAAIAGGASASQGTGDAEDMPVSSPGQRSGFLGAPTALPAGVVESNEPEATTLAVPVDTPPVAAAATSGTATGGHFMVQVGAIGDHQRAQSWQQTLSSRFGVPGKVTANGNLYRVQLGPFHTRHQAQAIQQRLSSEAQQQSFIAAQ